MKLCYLGHAALLVACFSCASYKKCKTTEITDLVVVQDGVENIVNDNNKTVKLRKSDFSIRFYNKRYAPESQEFYSAQLVAFANKNEMPKIEAGMQKSNIAALKPGTGMASGSDGKYSALIFKNTAHHYLFYKDSTSQRVDLIKQDEEYLKLEFSIEAAILNGEKYSIDKFPLSEFYILVVIDRNLDGIINTGEFKQLTLKVR